MSAIIYKPSARYQVPDWFRHNCNVADTSNRELTVSHDTRQGTSQTLNEAEIKTKWDYHDTNNRLCDRIRDVESWKLVLEQTLKEIDAEIVYLSNAKTAAEDELEQRHFDLETGLETLAIREGRRTVDIVKDEVEIKLNEEIQAIKDYRSELQERCNQAFEQLSRLQEARQKLQNDITDKYKALDIDSLCLSLTPQSPNISFKPHCMRMPKDTVTVQQWQDHSRHNKERADYQMCQSSRLRDTTMATLAQGRNRLDAHHTAVQFALRQRLHELHQTHDDLVWQRTKLEQEIATVEEDIRTLEAAIRDKDPYRKLAETRLEYRMDRPNMELAYDPPCHGLREERLSVQATQELLGSRLQQLWDALDRLRRQLAAVQEDISVKANSVRLDRLSLDTHGRTRPPAPPRDRNYLDKVLLLRPERSVCERGVHYLPRPDLLPGHRTEQDCSYTAGCSGSQYRRPGYADRLLGC